MEQPSFLQRIVDLFFMPSRAFVGLTEHFSYKEWLYPLLIVTTGLVILPLFYRDISFAEADQRLLRTERNLAANADISDDARVVIDERMAKARSKIDDSRENPLAFRNLWGYLLIPLMLFVMAAFFSALLLLIGNFGMGGNVKFFAIFSMVMMTYLISGNGFFMNMLPGVGTLELIVKTPMIVMRGSTDVVLSPGLFFESMDSFPKQFFNQLDLFRMWGMVVMGFGFAKLFNKSTTTGIVAVAIPWTILVVVGAALLQANSKMMG